jgi:hypothetical protein
MWRRSGHSTFDSETGFNDSVKRRKENLTTGTWGPLLKMLTKAEVPFDRCFFTNAFMGQARISQLQKLWRNEEK